MNTTGKEHTKSKKIFAFVLLIIATAVFVFIAYKLAIKFMKIASDGVQFKDFIKGYGALGILVAIILQILQVFVVLIPGEFMEIGLGFAFGWLGGCLVSLTGVAIGSTLIFLLVKKFGMRIIGYFMPVEKIDKFRIINTEKRLRRVTFILFFLPGTPKALLTYFFGLTRITLGEFLSITLFARIPTVISSTVGGNFIGSGKYAEAVALFVLTALVSVAGLKLYEKMMAKIKAKYEGNYHSFSSFIEKHKNKKDK